MRLRNLFSISFFVLVLTIPICAQDSTHYLKKNTWHETVLASSDILAKDIADDGGGVLLDLAKDDFTISLWIKTTLKQGRIFTKSVSVGGTDVGSKSLSLSKRGGWIVWSAQVPPKQALGAGKQTDENTRNNLAYSVGALGENIINDGEWHHVAVSTSNIRHYFYLDGEPLANHTLYNWRRAVPDVEEENIYLGPPVSPGYEQWTDKFVGSIDELQLFNRRLTDEEINSLYKNPGNVKDGLAGWWTFNEGMDDATKNSNNGDINNASLVEGKFGKSLEVGEEKYSTIPAQASKVQLEQIMELTKKDFNDETSLKQINWEIEDGIWYVDRKPGDYSLITANYVAATRPILGLDKKAADIKDDMNALREVYYQSREAQENYDALKERLAFVTEEVEYLSTEHTSDEVRWSTYTMDVSNLAKSINSNLSKVESGDVAAAANSAELLNQLELLHDGLPHKLPSGPAASSEFGAVHDKLKYTLDWDRVWRVSQDADVVVNFDEVPYKMVFWRGTNYIPAWVTEHNGPWFVNEFFERRGWLGGGNSMVEPMSDKQNHYSHVRVIENNPARVVVHWRYAPTDLDYNLAYIDPVTKWADWADEYWYIYPDGVAMREATLMSSGPNEDWIEYQESIFINQPGTKPSDNVPQEAVTLANIKGETHTYTWERKFPSNFDKLEDPVIQYINFFTDYTQYSVVSPEDLKISAYPKDGRFKDEEYFNTWDAWPVSQDWSDARKATNFNKVSHSNLTHLVWKPYVETPAKRTWLMMTGMTNQKPGELKIIAKSWLHAPELKTSSSGYVNEGYKDPERAYHLSCNTPNNPGNLNVNISASEDAPVVNLAFVIKGWGNSDVALKIDGEDIPQSKDFRVGYSKDFIANDVIIYLNIESEKPVEMEITPIAK